MADDDRSPLDGPEGDWWNDKVNRRETMWLGISGAFALSIFGWMVGWTRFGEQNPSGQTYRVSAEQFREKVQSYKQAAATATVGGEEMLVPQGEDVYVGAYQWNWDALPAVLEPGTEYRFHLGSYDVNHGLGVRPGENLSRQVSLQIVPGYEWVVPMTFDQTGTYHVVCNAFCGTGHRTMHGKFAVQSYDDLEMSEGSNSGGTGDGGSTGEYGGWFGDETGGAVPNYDGTTDATGRDEVTVTVGPGGNSVYAPPAVRVDPGTTVTFEWASSNHNVVVESRPDGADWSGHEPLEDRGFTHSHTFETSGVYEYYCDPHLPLGMKGIVEVA